MAFIFSIFDNVTTSRGQAGKVFKGLWMAFIFSIFDNVTTSKFGGVRRENGCEWLSFFLSLTTSQHLESWVRRVCSVVNGFHFFYLWQRHNISLSISKPLLRLWMAFIFSIFDNVTTSSSESLTSPLCCEWLSFFLSLTTSQHRWFVQGFVRSVVNGFHFFYLWQRHNIEEAPLAPFP